MQGRAKRHSVARRKTRIAKASKRRVATLTTPDLVVLSLLTERPMHGYEANLELERRCIRDWAEISRPQVYYSLDKLERLNFVAAGESSEPAEGPERRVFHTTAKGRKAIADALESEEWALRRERPALLTWLALSWLARPGVTVRQIERRREFLKQELKREEETLEGVLKEVGHAHHEAVWMISLMMEQFKTELRWLEKVQEELPTRANAKNPELASPAQE